MAHEIVLKNAKVVDGTSAPWFRASIAIDDGTISDIYKENEDIDSNQIIDVNGSVISPGFIDTHSHSDLRLFEDPALEPKIRQGITTEILGQDGFSMGPIHQEEAIGEWEDQLSGLAGRMDREWDWRSIAEYFDAIEENGIAPNVATLVGHGTVRFNVLGMDSRSPSDSELEEMADLVQESLEEGAIGLSTGLVYTPQYHATKNEVQRLAKSLSPFNRPFVAHIRSERFEIWEAFDEFMDIGADEDVPLHHSHFKVIGPPGKGKAELATELVQYARERGIDYTADVYPYTASSTRLLALLPPWVKSNSQEDIIEKLQSESIREQIRADITEWRLNDWHNPGQYVGWESIVIASIGSAQNEDIVGQSIESIAKEWDSNSIDVICDLLIEEELEVTMTLHQLDEDDVRTVLSSEGTCIATDGIFGGGKPHPRLYGTYPKVLGTYVREENVLSLEEAIHKMTALPAQLMGLYNKGVIRPDMDADLVVFNPRTVQSPASYENPRCYPDGIDHVLVNGQFIIRNGELTDKLPGEVIRA